MYHFSIQGLPRPRMFAALAMCLAVGGCASAGGEPIASSSMPTGPLGFTPTGFIDFCARQPDQCGITGQAAGEPLRARLVRQQWTEILSPASIQGQAAAESAASALIAVEPTASITLATAPQQALTPQEKAPGALELAFQPEAALDVVTASETGPFAPISDVPLAEARILSTTAPAAAVAAPVGVATPAAERPSGFETPARPATLAISEENWSLLQRVNQDINARILPASDMAAFGQEDYWTLPISAGGQPRGNCKHYALEKLKALAEAGIPRDALTLAIPRTGWGELHAVLIVATDHGDFVLDNLNSRILPWDRTGYHWIARQTPGAPLRWMDLERADARRG